MHRLIADNFIQHAFKFPELTESMVVKHLDHLIYCDSGLSCDTFNIIYIKSPRLKTEEIQSAIEYFHSMRRNYCIWVAKENLTDSVYSIFKELNITLQAQEEGMALELSNYTSTTLSSHSNVHQVGDLSSLAEYANVIAKNWTPPDGNVNQFYDLTATHYLNDKNGVLLFTYLHDYEPASTVEMFPTDDKTIGLYGFTTLEKFRGQGIGTALLTFCLTKAKELGYHQVVLQGTEDGIGIYKKYGFKEISSYFEYQ